MPSVIEEVARAICEDENLDFDDGLWRDMSIARANSAIRTLLSGPVGDVLRAALAVAEDGKYHSTGVFFASPTWMQIIDSLDALPSEITDMLGSE